MSERALETIEKLVKVLGVVVVVGTIAIAAALVVVNVSDDESPAPPPADEAPSGPIASIPGAPQDLKTTNRVWERYKERLIDHYDAIGGGVGADGIIIFVEHYADVPTAPQSVRGVPIQFMVTDIPRAQPAQ